MVIAMGPLSKLPNAKELVAVVVSGLTRRGMPMDCVCAVMADRAKVMGAFTRQLIDVAGHPLVQAD